MREKSRDSVDSHPPSSPLNLALFREIVGNPQNAQRMAKWATVPVILSFLFWIGRSLPPQLLPYRGGGTYQTQPLAMAGGDPYIRALMRTITASESNVNRPYHVLYGGETVSNLSRHPDRCMPILRGPNRGNCSTAAGRYQFINTTWAEKARHYHPHPTGIFWWKTYSFEPLYQDKVVYNWLSDPKAWNADLAQLLREGQVVPVLRLLSGTWTSLGYGLENNLMSASLPQIYQKMLEAELRAQQTQHRRSFPVPTNSPNPR